MTTKVNDPLHMQNPILRVLLRDRFLCSRSSCRHFTGVKPLQHRDQPDGVVHGQAGDRQQPDGGEPVERYEVDEDVDHADDDVEYADHQGREKTEPLVLGKAIEDSREGSNIQDTPDDRPDPVAGAGPTQKSTKDIDDPDQDKADAHIPEKGKVTKWSNIKYSPHSIDNIHTEAELLKTWDLAAKRSESKHFAACLQMTNLLKLQPINTAVAQYNMDLRDPNQRYVK